MFQRRVQVRAFCGMPVLVRLQLFGLNACAHIIVYVHKDWQGMLQQLAGTSGMYTVCLQPLKRFQNAKDGRFGVRNCTVIKFSTNQTHKITGIFPCKVRLQEIQKSVVLDQTVVFQNEQGFVVGYAPLPALDV